MVAWAGDGAVRDDLLMNGGRASVRLGLSAALRQAVIVDLILFIGNLFTEPEGTRKQQQARTLLVYLSLILEQALAKLCLSTV